MEPKHFHKQARKARQKAEKEKAEKEAKEAAARGADEPAPEKVSHCVSLANTLCPLLFFYSFASHLMHTLCIPSKRLPPHPPLPPSPSSPHQPRDEDPTGRLYVDKCVGTTAELEKWLTPCLPVLDCLSSETLVAVATALLHLDKVGFVPVLSRIVCR
jgi:hypothetical protein